MKFCCLLIVLAGVLLASGCSQRANHQWPIIVGTAEKGEVIPYVAFDKNGMLRRDGFVFSTAQVDQMVHRVLSDRKPYKIGLLWFKHSTAEELVQAINTIRQSLNRCTRDCAETGTLTIVFEYAE